MTRREEILPAVSQAATVHAESRKGPRTSSDVIGAVAERNIPLLFRPLDKLWGAFITVNDEERGIIVTIGLGLPVQRFTVAHELGHLMLGHSQSGTLLEIPVVALPLPSRLAASLHGGSAGASRSPPPIELRFGNNVGDIPENMREPDTMSDLTDQLHENARRRFEELGRSLLARVATFRGPPAPARPSFSPNTFTDQEITDADIAGDLRLGWRDTDGKPTGIAVAEAGGLRTGLIGPDYEVLEALALSMARVHPFKLTASVEFLRTQLFEWAVERHRQRSSAGCVDYVLRALESAASEYRLLFPVSDLHVQSPLTLGSVTVSTFPESIFEELESKQTPPSAAGLTEWCRSLRQDFQGLAAAETYVFGEPIRAQEIASDRVELAIGVLRFYAPGHLNSGVTSRVARWGYAPQRRARVFVAEASGRFSSTTASLIDQPGTMVLSDATREVLLGAGLSEMLEILARESRTDLERALLTGMITFGRAAISPDLRERMIWYCAGLESILLKDRSESILQNLSERLAIFGYDTVGERAAAVKDVKEAYSLRSGFVHHGVEIGEREVVTRFARHGLRLFCRIVQNAASFRTKLELLDHIDRMKLSGASLT